jgi:hypothetical protein
VINVTRVGRDTLRCPYGAQDGDLGFSKVDVEHGGLAKPQPSPRNIRLLRKEDVSLFQIGHDIGVPLNLPMTNAFARDHLNHTDQARRQALKGDNSVPWIHIAL